MRKRIKRGKEIFPDLAADIRELFVLAQINKIGERHMKLGITLLGELKEMKEKIDLVWNDLFERSPGRSEEDSQWAEKLPISEGMGRRSFTSKSNEHINSFRFSGELGYSLAHAFGAAPDNGVPAKVYFNRN